MYRHDFGSAFAVQVRNSGCFPTAKQSSGYATAVDGHIEVHRHQACVCVSHCSSRLSSIPTQDFAHPEYYFVCPLGFVQPNLLAQSAKRTRVPLWFEQTSWFPKTGRLVLTPFCPLKPYQSRPPRSWRESQHQAGRQVQHQAAVTGFRLVDGFMVVVM